MIWYEDSVGMEEYYLSQSEFNLADSLCILMPLAYVGTIIWAFSSGKRSFGWGMMWAISPIIVLFILFILLKIFVVFGNPY